MLMEQTPSSQNWQRVNALKRPGVLRLWSYLAMAHGADTVMYFQWRRGRGHSATLVAASLPTPPANLAERARTTATRPSGGDSGPLDQRAGAGAGKAQRKMSGKSWSSGVPGTAA